MSPDARDHSEEDASVPDDVPVLVVRDLTVSTTGGVEIVSGVSFDVRTGMVLALVGESGCGKTSTALALLAHARAGTRISKGTVQLRGQNLLALDNRAVRKLRGASISYVPQDPTSGLNPRHRIGAQVAEPLIVHGTSKEAARAAVRELFARVHLPSGDEFLKRYAFELSGGQQQRVAIAMALACRPSVVVLDEPTTGLDVTTQARVLELLLELSRTMQTAFVYVTHDLAVVNELADHVAVMYAGIVVESGARERLFARPQHPYTSLLLGSVPRLAARRRLLGIAGTAPGPADKPETGCPFEARCPLAVEQCRTNLPELKLVEVDHSARCWRSDSVAVPLLEAPEIRPGRNVEPLLSISGLVASYRQGGRPVEVLHGVSLSLSPGECLAVVGESGSGKTTLGRCVAGLHRPDRGDLKLDETALAPLATERSQEELRTIQIIFQNPDRSLNPRETIEEALWRPLNAFYGLSRRAADADIRSLLSRVRLPESMRLRYPSDLSGGERQRVAIARALAPKPRVLVCDEITSALDVSIQAAIIALLDGLRDDDMALLFITHNLALVNSIADHTLVLENGHVREFGITEAVIEQAAHPYTQALLAAAPDLPI